MIKYIPFYPHEFFNDPRLLQLETKEQQQWLFLLARMMLTCASIPENYKAIGRTLDISTTAAQKLITKLKRIELLVASETGHQLLSLSSPRLTREYLQAKTACEVAKAKAKAAADARWHPEKKITAV